MKKIMLTKVKMPITADFLTFVTMINTYLAVKSLLFGISVFKQLKFHAHLSLALKVFKYFGSC